MQRKQKFVYIASCFLLLFSGVALLISVWAQAPQKAQIVFHSIRGGNGEIYVMDADGMNQRRLANPASGADPVWSPDGKSIAFTSTRDGNSEIYLMDANGNNQHRLTSNPADDIDPAWSPDGQKIAFGSYRDGNYEIYVMDADGKNQRNLTNNPADDFGSSWFDPAYAVFPAGKLRGTWGWLKQASK